MQVNRYLVTLEADRRKIVRIETTSTDWKIALRNVLRFEGAPVSAVLAIAELGVVA